MSVLIGSFVSKNVVLLFHNPEEELKHAYFLSLSSRARVHDRGADELSE